MSHLRARVFRLCSFVCGLFFIASVHAAPSAPATLSTASLKATSFMLKWTAATGATGGIAGYDIYKNGVLTGSTTSARSLPVTGLAPSTAYSMTVVARDNSGGVSPASAPLVVTTMADTTVPTKPAGLAASAVTTTSFHLSWTASTDNVGVSGYNVYRAGTLVGSTPATGFDVSGQPVDTINRMTVRARDAAGNLSASAALNVRTLANPPSIPTGLTVANLKAASFTLKWTASTGGTGGIANYDVYRDGVLAGTTTKKTYAFTAQIPATTRTLTVAARDHEGRVSAPSAAISVTTPADTTKPSVPKDLAAASVTHVAFTLQWSASTDNVAVVAYEILRNNVVIGTSATPSFMVTGLSPLTTYSMRVRAKDAAGNVSANSAILSVTTAEVPNVVPTVTLTAPTANSTFTLPLAFTLAATATDSDGTIAQVEFFDGVTSLGSATTPSTPPATFTLPVTLAAAGPHSLRARATDNRHATTDSAVASIRLLPGLPYIANFEEAEGYLAGSLDEQKGWTVAAGHAAVSANDAAHGEQSVLLEAGATAAWVDQEIGASATNPSPVFVDLFSRPAVGTDATNGSRFDLDGGRLAFVLQGSAGRFAALDGNGADAGTWTTLPVDVALDANHLASAWTRLSARLDYGTKKWDFYLDGHLLAADLGFRLGGATYFSGLSFQGHAALGTGVDDLYAGADNPLFTDADHDGMEDAWETAHGLNPAANDRNTDPDGDGLGNVQEYVLGTDPQNPDTDNDGLSDGQEKSLGTNALIADTDDDGLPDGWEQSHGLNPLSDADAATDADHDGQSNAEEFQAGTDPADYYNGAAPVITVLAGGNGTPGPDGLLQVLVSNAAGDPLADAPVTFAITAGSSKLAASSDAGAPLFVTLPFRTLADGTASVYYRTPEGESAAGTVNVQVGASATDLVFASIEDNTPVVRITAPLNGTLLSDAAGIVIVATTAHFPAPVAKMEFFADGVKLSESATAPYYFVWTSPATGAHVLTATATDSAGARITSSATTIIYAPAGGPVLSHGFEPAEGFLTGPLAGQNTWAVHYEETLITTAVAHGGQQSVALQPAGTDIYALADASLDLEPLPDGQTVRYVDFWIKAVANDSANTSTVASFGDGPQVYFRRNGATAEFLGYFYIGDGGFQEWRSGRQVAVGNNGTLDWHRVTIRQDSSAQIQDVYLDGQMALSGMFYYPGSDRFTVTGRGVVPAYFDDVQVTFTNPFFADADHDGMDDAWEAAHGLSPAVNDRDGDPDGDNLRNVAESGLGTNPRAVDSDGDGLPDGWEVDHHFDPTVPVSATQDSDQDGLPDGWEYSTGSNPFKADSNENQLVDGEEDEDGDGLTSFQEYQQGTDVHDFYNGLVPIMTPLADYSVRLGLDGMVAVKVTNQSGVPLPNAPVQFDTSAENLLTANPYGEGRVNSLIVRADSRGIARVYVRPGNF